jgi:NAD(P)-dependent dehydrogenase (short-subunit alcohol dehydrogenase family)
MIGLLCLMTSVLITGAARGIGAALAERLHAGGARVALAGLEPDRLAEVASRCAAPWRECDIGDPRQVERAVGELVAELGGLDVVVANAGIAKQLPLIGGDPAVMTETVRVNLLGTYHTLRVAGEHIAHPGGYAVVVASLAAAVHPPLLGAYSAAKAGVAALGATLRAELAPTGARVGVAYFAELDTDMTSRGFGTAATAALTGGGPITSSAPLRVAVDALDRGIARRARRIVAPRWVGLVLPIRGVAQRVVDRRLRGRVDEALRIARAEDVPFTTPQPGAS